MRKVFTLLALSVMLVGPWVAKAEAVSFSGFYLDPTYTGPVLLHFSGLDSAAVYAAPCLGVVACNAAQIAPGTPIAGGTAGVAGGAAGEDSWGVFKVTSITAPDLHNLWLPTATETMSGIFYNAQDFMVTFPGGGVQHIDSTGVGGGSILVDIYINPADPGAVGAPGARVGATYPGYAGMAGSLFFMTLASIPGSDAATPAAHLSGDFNLGTAIGSSQMFANMVPGSGPGASFFTGQTVLTNIGTLADFGMSFDIKPAANPIVTPGASPWTVQFNDPAVTFVPEPSSLLLLGSSLLAIGGIGYLRRRR